MIPILAIAGLAASAIGGIASGIGAKNQARKTQLELKRKRRKLDEEYAQDKNTDYLDTDAARSTLALLRRQNNRQMEAMNNNAVKTGASDEAKVAAAGRMNDSYAGAVSQIAGMGTEYKQRLKENYKNRADSLDDALLNVNAGKAQATSDMIGTTSQAVGGLLTSYGMGGAKSKTTTKSGGMSGISGTKQQSGPFHWTMPSYNFGTGGWKTNAPSLAELNVGRIL